MEDEIKISIIMPVYNVQNFLEDALKSIQNQTFDDYEVIMVDDGSSDGSFEIMKRFSDSDPRFKSFSKENQGVSLTRNFALDHAKGEYIAFLDGDDLMPKKALEIMYRTAKEQKAQIVVGKMQEFSLAKKRIYKHTDALSKKKIVSKYDEDLIWSMMLGNKLFSRDLIESHGIRFEEIKYSEDAIFTMTCVYNSSVIAGCTEITNHYRKRLFWEGNSVTQKVNSELFHDFIYAYEKVIAMAQHSLKRDWGMLDAGASRNVLQLRYTEISYISALYEKLAISIMDQFYRQLWKEDDNVTEAIAAKIVEYKNFIIPQRWDKILKQNPELRLNKTVLTPKELAKKPLISIVITGNVKKEELQRVMASIYNQLFPAFEVLIQKNQYNFLEDFYKNKINLKVIDANTVVDAKNKAVKISKGMSILFVDQMTMFGNKTLINMYKELVGNKTDMTVMKMKQLESNEIKNIEAQEVVNVLCYRQPAKCKTRYNNFDNVLSNKLLRLSTLKSMGFQFTDKPWKDCRKLYKKCKFKKLIEYPIITSLSNKDFTKYIFILSPVRYTYKHKYKTEFKRTKLYQSRQKKVLLKKKQLRKKRLFRLLKAVFPVFKQVFFFSIRNDGSLLENSDAVYQALPDVKKVAFCSRLPHTKKEKLEIYWRLLTSKVIVTDDYCKYLREFKLRPSQKVVQIWHACGAFKKFSLDYPSSDRTTEKLTHCQYTDVIVSSENVRKYYAGAFGIDIEKVKSLGVPRTDDLIDQSKREIDRDRFFEKFPEYKGKKVILFCPTFREKNNKQIKYNTKINWKQLNELLDDDEVLLVKKHPIMKYDLLGGKKYSKIKNVNKISTYTLMNISSLMITDYSSVIFEYSLFHKPVIFYCPDYYEYERDFYLHFPEELYGEFVTDPEELPEKIHQSILNKEIPGHEEFREKTMGSCDGHAAKRVADLIKSYLI